MPQYKFVLESVSGFKEQLDIGDKVVGWDTSQPTLTRDETYHGVIRSFTVDLTFIDEGYSYLMDLYEEEGVLSECLIYIYEHNNSIHEFELQDIGKVDFSSFNQSDKEGQGLTLTITDTAFAEKIRGREDTEINYNNNVDLDDNVMSDPAYVDQTILGMEVISKGSIVFTDAYVVFSIFSTGYDYEYFWVPAATISGQIEGLKSPVGEFVQTNAGEIEFFKAPFAGSIQFSGSLLFDFVVQNTLTPNSGTVTFSRQKEGESSVTISSLSYTDGVYSDQELDLSGTFDIEENERFFILTRARTDAGGEPLASELTLKESTIEVIQKDQAEPTISKGALLFDCFNRSVESLTGVSDSLISSVLDFEGEFHDYTIQNGFLIRNYTAEESALSWKFKDLFQNVEKILNIGLGIKSDNTFEIRKKKDFFKDGVIHTVTAKEIEADSFNREIDTDYFFSDIEIGYTKSAYEEVSGLEEYNNQSYFNTILSIINNKLEGNSKIRGDGYGIEFVRRSQKEDDTTEDTKYDSDLFILNVIDDGGYKQLTTEGFTDISGIDQISTPTNLNITPAQNFRRWGWLIATGLQKYQSNKIKFNKSDFESDLSTTKDGVTVSESSDITYEELEAPIFTGHKLIFTAKLSLSDYKTIKASPYQLIKVWNPIDEAYTYGWIREIGVESADKSTNWELIEAIEATEVLKFLLLNSGNFLKLNNGSGLLLNDQN